MVYVRLRNRWRWAVRAAERDLNHKTALGNCERLHDPYELIFDPKAKK